MDRPDEATGIAVLITGPPGAGKTAVGREVVAALRRGGGRAELLDEHEVREWLGPIATASGDPSALERLVRVAHLLVRNDVIVVIAAVAPTREVRESIRAELGTVVEAFVDTPAQVRSERMHPTLALVDYEDPIVPDVRVLTHDRPPSASAAQIVSHLEIIGAAVAPPRP